MCSSSATPDDVFVKCYPQGTNLDAELEAITLTGLAARHGVPVAPVIPAAGGQAIAANGPTVISAWQWMPGSPGRDGLTIGQAEQAGSALGRIHAAFAQLPASSGPAVWVADSMRTVVRGTVPLVRRRVASGVTRVGRAGPAS
jgi:Ser/Thr protein kinase RdoA (MazF antagonist)